MRTLCSLVSLSLVLAASGCGDKKIGNYITAWAQPPDEIAVGQTAQLSVILAQDPTEKTYVDVTNASPTLVEVTPMTLTFRSDAAPPTNTKQFCTIKGLAKSNGYVTLHFKLRDSTASRDLDVKVVSVSQPDYGAPLPPDQGAAKPDAAPVPQG